MEIKKNCWKLPKTILGTYQKKCSEIWVVNRLSRNFKKCCIYRCFHFPEIFETILETFWNNFAKIIEKIFLKFQENFSPFCRNFGEITNKFELILKKFWRPRKLWKTLQKFNEILKKNWKNSETVFKRHLKSVQKCKQWTSFWKTLI